MTPDGFATKWLTKFRSLLVNKYSTPASPQVDKSWLCTFCYEGFEHVIFFSHEAYTLRLSTNDFPDEYHVFDAHTRITKRLDPAAEFPADMPMAEANPFTAAMITKFWVDLFAESLEGMKMKGDTLFGTTWQEIPLEHRKGLNELFPMIEMASKKGWWWKRQGGDSSLEGFWKANGKADSLK